MKIRCMNCMEEYGEDQSCCPACGFVKGTPPKEIYHLYPETVLCERYQIGTVVAYGGFGILYRAWDQKLKVMVAVKEYFPSSYVNRNPGEKEVFIYTSKKQGEFQEGLEGFLSEARNTAKFSKHPNIVNVYDYFKENGTAYMVMEFMEGMTLKQYTKEQGGRLEWQEAVRIITSICDDLQIVHEAGILHRDISPDNIMLCKDGSIKLFDFGAARFSETEREVTRTIILKIGFAPPEQYRAKSRQGPWTDVYALGATLYRTITGELPDESVNRQDALLREGKDTLVSPKVYLPDIPDYLDAAISRAMAVEQGLRFKNVLQLKDALLNKKQYAEVEKELKLRKMRRKIGIAAVTAALFCGIGGCFFYYKNRQTETTLQGADVTVWSVIREGENVDSKMEILSGMLEEFRSDYTDVSVEVSCFPEVDYDAKLQEAAVAGTFPTLYECVGGQGVEGRQDELSGVLELLDLNEYYCMDQNNLGTEIYHLPLGMHLPVVYVNTLLQDGGKAPKKDNDVSAFLSGDSLLMVSDTDDYGIVQEKLPGIYMVKRLDTGVIDARFDSFWAVDSNAGELNRNAAKRILYYFLGETAQDILHVQNENGLPLNRNEMDAYLEINQEFVFLKEQLNSGIPVAISEGEAYLEKLETSYEEMVADGEVMEALKNK